MTRAEIAVQVFAARAAQWPTSPPDSYLMDEARIAWRAAVWMADELSSQRDRAREIAQEREEWELATREELSA